VVEGNETTRAIVAEILGELGLTVATASTQAEALAAAAGRRPQVALVSAVLGAEDGFAAAAALRAASGAAPIMMLTALAQTEGAVRCREEHIAAYVTKPVERERLAAAVPVALGLGPEEEERPEAPARRGERPLKVLVAEDSAVNRKLLLRILEKHGHV